jgi:predicted nucleic acid-binding protein
VEPVALDTDVASRLFRGRLSGAAVAQLADRKWCVTFVTVGEMAAWGLIHSWGPRLKATLEHWVGRRDFVNCSVEAARIWGMLSAGGRSRGRLGPANDTWIAACCLADGLPLATRNADDFADIVAHHGLELFPIE